VCSVLIAQDSLPSNKEGIATTSQDFSHVSLLLLVLKKEIKKLRSEVILAVGRGGP
jgi:hypothetical protein